jgi:4-carboxymuconolactone decarboxylase
MRLRVCAACLLGFWSIGQAQAPSKPEVHLVGDRFRPLVYDEMTPPQKTLIDHVLAGERHNLGGIFNVLLRSPEMGDLLQQYGAYARFHSGLPPKVQEIAILLTARYWTAQFEWNAHKRAAIQAGLSKKVIDDIASGQWPTGLGPDEEAAYRFCNELLNTKRVSDATYEAAKAQFKETGVVNIMGLVGFYQISSMMLNVDRYPMPQGVQPELKPLPQPLPLRADAR